MMMMILFRILFSVGRAEEGIVSWQQLKNDDGVTFPFFASRDELAAS